MRWIAALFLSLLAAAPASQPTTQATKPFKSLQQIINSIPKSIKPAEGGGWDEYHTVVLNEWLKTNVVGKRLACDGHVATISRENESDIVSLTRDEAISFRGHKFHTPTPITAWFDHEASKTTLANFKQDDAMRFEGTITDLSLPRPEDVGGFNLILHDVSIERSR